MISCHPDPGCAALVREAMDGDLDGEGGDEARTQQPSSVIWQDVSRYQVMILLKIIPMVTSLYSKLVLEVHR